MPVTRHPALGEWDGHPAGADGELERPSVAGEFGEAIDGGVQHLGREHAGARACHSAGRRRRPRCLPVARALPRNNGGLSAVSKRQKRLRCSPYRPADQSVPGPVRDGEAVRHVVGGAVVAGHRGGGRPGEVVVQHLTEPVVAVEADVGQRLVEAVDGAVGPSRRARRCRCACARPRSRRRSAREYVGGPPSASAQ